METTDIGVMILFLFSIMVFCELSWLRLRDIKDLLKDIKDLLHEIRNETKR